MIRNTLRSQLQYLRRNLSHIEQMLEQSALSEKEAEFFELLQTVYEQQKAMYKTRVLVDKIYRNRNNLQYCTARGLSFCLFYAGFLSCVEELFILHRRTISLAKLQLAAKEIKRMSTTLSCSWQFADTTNKLSLIESYCLQNKEEDQPEQGQWSSSC